MIITHHYHHQGRFHHCTRVPGAVRGARGQHRGGGDRGLQQESRQQGGGGGSSLLNISS